MLDGNSSSLKRINATNKGCDMGDSPFPLQLSKTPELALDDWGSFRVTRGTH